MKQICNEVKIIGGGLAGAEAAWQLAERGIQVLLYEMRPSNATPAHETGLIGELVCSNSLGGQKTTTPAGILKAELTAMGSLLMECADKTKVPAGNALAVDRILFAEKVDGALSVHPNIKIIREEIIAIPDGPAIISTGPLTSNAMAEKLKELVGDGFL